MGSMCFFSHVDFRHLLSSHLKITEQASLSSTCKAIYQRKLPIIGKLIIYRPITILPTNIIITSLNLYCTELWTIPLPCLIKLQLCTVLQKEKYTIEQIKALMI